MSDALRPAVAQGAIGERSLENAIVHSEQFLAAIPHDARRLIDLGSGGGLPGVVIARHRPDLEIRLVDRREARTDVLWRVVACLGMEDRVSVHTVDARDLVGDPEWVGWADVVTARSFGAPVTLVTLARPLLRPGGCLVVSAPPPGDDRWTSAVRDASATSTSPGVMTLLFA